MAVKQLFLASLCVVATIASPATRDLVVDIFQAERKVGFFDLEVNTLSSRIYSFGSEVNLPLTNWANDLRERLAVLQVTNYDQIDALLTLSDEQINKDIEVLESTLRQVRFHLLAINDNLENDLPSLSANVDQLNATVASGDEVFDAMFAAVQTSVVDIEAAMKYGIGTMENEDVTRAWVTWRHIRDVLVNEQFLTENVKLVYDVRGQECFDALELVVGQVPVQQK